MLTREASQRFLLLLKTDGRRINCGWAIKKKITKSTILLTSDGLMGSKILKREGIRMRKIIVGLIFIMLICVAGNVYSATLGRRYVGGFLGQGKFGDDELDDILGTMTIFERRGTISN